MSVLCSCGCLFLCLPFCTFPFPSLLNSMHFITALVDRVYIQSHAHCVDIEGLSCCDADTPYQCSLRDPVSLPQYDWRVGIHIHCQYGSFFVGEL